MVKALTMYRVKSHHFNGHEGLIIGYLSWPYVYDALILLLSMGIEVRWCMFPVGEHTRVEYNISIQSQLFLNVLG